MASTFVEWRGRNGDECRHLRIPGSGFSLCGKHVNSAQRPGDARCPACLQIYLRIMTDTDELVGMFGEDGRVRK